MHKSRTQPLCRCCGKPIAKHVDTVYVRDKQFGSACRGILVIPDGLYSKADCQKHTNQTVMAVRYTGGRGHYSDDQSKRRVLWFTTWDGETYKDEFFCTMQCGERFGRLAAKHNAIQSVAYADAMKRARGEKVA